MATRVNLEIDPADKILLKRSLDKNGKGQRFFTSEVKRLSDPYTPFRTGHLKNSATVLPGKIIYNAPYARKQWYDGREKGLRGPYWVKRMWSDRGKEIVASVAKYCGGKTK